MPTVRGHVLLLLKSFTFLLPELPQAPRRPTRCNPLTFQASEVLRLTFRQPFCTLAKFLSRITIYHFVLKDYYRPLLRKLINSHFYLSNEWQHPLFRLFVPL